MRLPLLEDLPDVGGRNVLVRCDFNVPLDAGMITNDLRIRAALPTLGWLVDRGAQVTACTHLGRPKGKPDPRFDLRPVRERLGELAPGVRLLDNLRFHPGEEAGDPGFVSELIAGQDFYVDDAFACAHRAHASVVGPPRYLPSAAGRLVAREVEVLSALLEEPRRPFVVVLGGAKVADKLGVVASLLRKADTVALGGAMCFTFLAADGTATGDSPLDEAELGRCRELLASGRIALPSDFVAVRRDAPAQVGGFSGGIPPGWDGQDIGPKSAARFGELIAHAGTVLWNGPMGRFENDRFGEGTRAVATAIADAPAFSVVGGGETTAAVERWGLGSYIDHLSTGGGATLEFLEHGDLPGLAALRESAARSAPTG